jgi:hypothetical protein
VERTRRSLGEQGTRAYIRRATGRPPERSESSTPKPAPRIEDSLSTLPAYHYQLNAPNSDPQVAIRALFTSFHYIVLYFPHAPRTTFHDSNDLFCCFYERHEPRTIYRDPNNLFYNCYPFKRKTYDTIYRLNVHHWLQCIPPSQSPHSPEEKMRASPILAVPRALGRSGVGRLMLAWNGLRVRVENPIEPFFL